jgi:hypothetical protein
MVLDVDAAGMSLVRVPVAPGDAQGFPTIPGSWYASGNEPAAVS